MGQGPPVPHYTPHPPTEKGQSPPPPPPTLTFGTDKKPKGGFGGDGQETPPHPTPQSPWDCRTVLPAHQLPALSGAAVLPAAWPGLTSGIRQGATGGRGDAAASCPGLGGGRWGGHSTASLTPKFVLFFFFIIPLLLFGWFFFQFCLSAHRRGPARSGSGRSGSHPGQQPSGKVSPNWGN